jgi:hypothetical protein
MTNETRRTIFLGRGRDLRLPEAALAEAALKEAALEEPA